MSVMMAAVGVEPAALFWDAPHRPLSPIDLSPALRYDERVTALS